MQRSEGLDAIDPECQGEENEHFSLSSEKTTSAHESEPTHTVVQKVDVPPDGGYGWVVVACVSVINAHTWGINSVCARYSHVTFYCLECFSNILQSYGVFLAHYLSFNTFSGASSLEYAFVGGLSISLALVIAPLATVCVGLFGTQFTLSIGIVLETAGLLGASWAS